MTRHRPLRPGDELPISRLEDLAASLEELGGRLRRLVARGVRLRFEGRLGPLSDIEAQALIQGILMAADFQAQATAAQLKTQVVRAREAGLFRSGRPRTLSSQRVAELRAAGLGATAIANRLGVARSSIYRKLREIEAPETRRLKPQADASATERPAPNTV
jgi:DNA invertase Pin-like site-specific DNA recombinase